MARHHDEGFGHSMTDLMAGVAVTFLLLAAIFMVQADKLKREAEAKKQEAEQQVEDLREQQGTKRQIDALASALRQALAEQGATDAERTRVVIDAADPFLLLVVFSSEGWFRSGRCEPEANVKEKVQGYLATVFRLVCDARYDHIQTITLEGHSDREPLCPHGESERCGAVESCTSNRDKDREAAGFNNNVRLSAARAQEVFFLARNEIRRTNEELVRTCLEPRFVISGRGPVEPHDGASWREERRKGALGDDRRVVLKVRFRPELPDGGTELGVARRGP